MRPMPADTDGHNCSLDYQVIWLSYSLPGGRPVPKRPPFVARWFLPCWALLREMGRLRADEDDHRPTIHHDAIRQAAGAREERACKTCRAFGPAVLGWELAGFDHGQHDDCSHSLKTEGSGRSACLLACLLLDPRPNPISLHHTTHMHRPAVRRDRSGTSREQGVHLAANSTPVSHRGHHGTYARHAAKPLPPCLPAPPALHSLQIVLYVMERAVQVVRSHAHTTHDPNQPEQSTGVEAVDEVGSSFTQFKLQKAPWDLRYIVYVIQVGPMSVH